MFRKTMKVSRRLPKKTAKLLPTLWMLQRSVKILPPIWHSLEEAFYMATMGGGSFFGKVGTFAEGYEFDALILDDSKLRHPQPLTARERLERLIYLSDDSCITGKYISGNKIF